MKNCTIVVMLGQNCIILLNRLLQLISNQYAKLDLQQKDLKERAWQEVIEIHYLSVTSVR